MQKLTIRAPAKLNLVLEVLGRRADGYHEIRSIMQAVDLCDVISFEACPDLVLVSDEPELQIPDNLIMRAGKLLKDVSGYGAGATMTLKKHIPWGAGLGGGSSDAAATLCGLNRLWGLGLDAGRLMDLGGRLGSDVPFFVRGGTAMIEGRGEKVTALPDGSPISYVIAVPPVPMLPEKTRRLYSMLSRDDFSSGARSMRLAEAMARGSSIGQDLFNAFERVACGAFAGLEDCWRRFARLAGQSVHLSGAGPALFTTAEDRDKARELCRQLRENGFVRCHAVTSLSGGGLCRQ